LNFLANFGTGKILLHRKPQECINIQKKVLDSINNAFGMDNKYSVIVRQKRLIKSYEHMSKAVQALVGDNPEIKKFFR
jgi:hypothetical protein